MSSGLYKLVVSKPCQENWNSMTPSGNGKHCKACDKNIIDFSALKDDEIHEFFLNNHLRPVCGRFRSTQLDRIRIHIPAYLFRKRIPFWKKFLIIFIVCFGHNLFPFDMVLGNNAVLYAQTAVTGSNKKNKPVAKSKKKKPSLRKIVIPDIDLNIDHVVILGFTQSIPVDPMSSLLGLPGLGALITNTPGSWQTPTHGNQTPGKDPGKSNSENKSAFILPARTNFSRRKKRSK